MRASLLLLLPLALSAAGPAPSLEEGAARLRAAALASEEAWTELQWLCDRIGHRLAGSPALEEAVRWAAARMAEDGLAVTLEAVSVPGWTRGEERAEVLAPVARPLALLGLGGSVGTPPEGIEAELAVVTSFEDLEARAAEAKGRIVLFDVPFTTYGETVAYRGRGAIAGAQAGAVAVLIRSVTPVSLASPHTGAVRYEEGVPPVPAAALSVEDAAFLGRLAASGEPVRVRLVMGAQDAGTRPSANVVGELRGRELPDEVVVLGCHLDSWDMGQGAQDDGAGCVAVMEAGALLAALPEPPRRTVRVVLYTNEENGLSGGKAYAAAHGAELAVPAGRRGRRPSTRIVAAMEADTGSGQPRGFRVDLRDPSTGEPDPERTAAAVETLRRYAPLLAGAGYIEASWSGADISPLVERGVPGLGLDQFMDDYWPVHHTAADTLDKVDPRLLKKNVAAVTAMAWILAEMPERLGGEPGGRSEDPASLLRRRGATL